MSGREGRLLKVIVYDTGIGRGGSKHSLLEWIELLRRAGHLEVSVYASGDGWLVSELSARDIPWRRLRMPPALGRIRHGSWRDPVVTASRILEMSLGLIGAWIKCLFIRGDVLLLTGARDFWTLFPLVWRMRRNATAIPQTTDWAKIPGCRAMCRIVAETWAISETVAESIRAMGIPPAKVRVLPLIFTRPSPPSATRESARVRLGVPPDGIVLGVVGVIREQKGQRIALEAFARIAATRPDVRLVIVGEAFGSDDDYAESLERRVGELGLEARVHFSGWVEDVSGMMRGVDIALVPSLDNEGVPRVILEALEAEVPVIASDLPQLREVLQSAGRCIPAGNVSAWTEALLDWLRHPAELHRAARSGRELWVARYSERAAAPAMIAAIENLSRAGA